MISSIASLGLLLFSGCCLGEEYSYDGNLGPLHWGDNYRACFGKHQSPINIEEHHVKNVSLPLLKLIRSDNPCALFVRNNGHTVMLKSNESKTAMLSGGPLRDEIYIFEQLHFHWGENDQEGSEDLINNRSFPMEMHAVFYKEDYKSMNEALKYHDGLTVLAYLYEVGSKSNPTYESIVKVLPDIEIVDTEKSLPESLLLEKLLVPNITTLQNYFTYHGSLTTPPCLEIVTWIDFKSQQQLSHAQLAAFRKLRTSEGNKLTHNFRPVQPIEDRIVLQNIPKEQNTFDNNNHSDEHSGHNIQMPVPIIALGILFAFILFAI